MVLLRVWSAFSISRRSVRVVRPRQGWASESGSRLPLPPWWILHAVDLPPPPAGLRGQVGNMSATPACMHVCM